MLQVSTLQDSRGKYWAFSKARSIRVVDEHGGVWQIRPHGEGISVTLVDDGLGRSAMALEPSASNQIQARPRDPR